MSMQIVFTIYLYIATFIVFLFSRGCEDCLFFFFFGWGWWVWGVVGGSSSGHGQASRGGWSSTQEE